MSQSPFYKEIELSAKTFFQHAKGSHDWEHTLRVCRLSERIGEKEQADPDVIRISALLHDIGRTVQDNGRGSVCHAEIGAELAEPVIRELDLSDFQKKNILHCIASHRFRGKQVPETIEARVLFDADKLDAIGAVGIARAYLFAGEIHAKLHNPEIDVFDTEPYSEEDTGYREYMLKLRNIRDRMMTRTGRHLAEGRHSFMIDFFDRFLKEYEGEL